MTRGCVLLSCMLLLLAGCADSPESRFFVLSPVPPSQPAAAVDGDPLVVDAVDIPESLDRPELVRRLNDYRMDVSDVDRWGAPLGRMIREVFIEDLAERLPRGMVVVDGRPGDRGPARAVVINIHDFAGWPGGEVKLDVSWAVLDGLQGDPVVRRRQTIQVPTGGTQSINQADGMSRALGTLADIIVSAQARA